MDEPLPFTASGRTARREVKVIRRTSSVLAILLATAFVAACGGEPPTTPTPITTPVPPPTPLELLASDETDAVIVGHVFAESGPDSAYDERSGGLVYRTWTVQVTEVLRGKLSGNSLRVRVDTHSLGTPIPPTGVRAGQSTGAPLLRRGETVLLFLTRNLPVVRPNTYPPLGIDEFMLVGPNVGKWIREGGRLRCDDPLRPSGEQVVVPYRGTIELLRDYAEDG